MEALRVSVRRGEIVEAVHRVHAVAVQDGAVVAEAGDSGLVCLMRSSSKPVQAVPLARARTDRRRCRNDECQYDRRAPRAAYS